MSMKDFGGKTGIKETSVYTEIDRICNSYGYIDHFFAKNPYLPSSGKALH